MLLRHIRYFLAVADHGNFTRAAEALHVSQPTLSQQIRQLEESLGVPLFDRSGRTVRLTDAGTAWQQHAQRALQEIAAGTRAIHDVQALTRGTLRLALTPTFTSWLLGPCIGLFNERYPGITLDIREMPQGQMEALLCADELDVGIAFDQVGAPEIDVEILLVEVLALVVGTAHPHANRQEPLPLQDFKNTPLVLFNDTVATRHFIDRYCQQHGVRATVAVEVNSIGAMLEIVRRGRLATILPEAIARDNPALRALHLATPLPTRPAMLLQRRGAYRTAAAQAFTAVLRDVARSAQPADT